MSPIVRFEPIDEEIECGEDETVLDAAFREGYSLAYGCREGQCSACKCYLLDGEVSLKTYSTFALSESEESQGYTLLCRAMPDSDLTVELLHFDPDGYRLAEPIRDGVATVTEVEDLTHDIVRLAMEIREPADFNFKPGQYVDLWIPGTDEKRSFSMANVPGDGRLEFIIKRYPGGHFSSMLGRDITPGDELKFTGPYGAFYLRATGSPVVMVAGGSGMAPVLALLRQLSAAGSTRTVRFFYGARSARDLFYGDLVAELGARLSDFEFIPVLSEPAPADDWQGPTGFVHEAVSAHLAEEQLEDPEAYMCGPAPMIEAATELLTSRGIDEGAIFSDKFTVAASAADDVGVV